MSISQLRSEASGVLRQAEVSPYRITLLYLLIINAVAVCFNLIVLWWGYRVDEIEGGLDAVRSAARYDTFAMTGSLLLGLFSRYMDGSYTAYSLELYQNTKADHRSLLNALRQFGRVLTLALLVSLFTALWMTLFIIPGIVAMYRYRFAFQILFDNPDISPFLALELSKRMTYGHKLELFQLDLSFFYFYLLEALGLSLVNRTLLLQLPPQPMQTEMLYYLAGVLVGLAAQALFLPHLRASQTAAYLQVKAQMEGENSSVSF